MRIDITDKDGKTVFVRERGDKAGFREIYCAAWYVAKSWGGWTDGETAWFDYNPYSDRIYGDDIAPGGKVTLNPGDYAEKINLLGIQTQVHSDEDDR